MTTMRMTAKNLGLAVLAVCCVLLTKSASASDWSFSFGFGRPVSYAPIMAPRYEPKVVRSWVPERYETREEQVLIREAHYEKRYVEPVYAREYDKHGHVRQVCTTQGFWQEVYVPAKYETRCSQVLIPGYWTETVLRQHEHRHRDEVTYYRGGDRRNDSVRANYRSR
jgi:hypothetical protein